MSARSHCVKRVCSAALRPWVYHLDHSIAKPGVEKSDSGASRATGGGFTRAHLDYVRTFCETSAGTSRSCTKPPALHESYMFELQLGATDDSSHRDTCNGRTPALFDHVRHRMQ